MDSENTRFPKEPGVHCHGQFDRSFGGRWYLIRIVVIDSSGNPFLLGAVLQIVIIEAVWGLAVFTSIPWSLLGGIDHVVEVGFVGSICHSSSSHSSVPFAYPPPAL
jgi:hypothetical protein